MLTACAGSGTQVVTVTAPAPEALVDSSSGATVSPESSEPLPFTLGEFGVVPMSMGGDYSVQGVVYIENPNPRHYLQSGQYRVTARDSSGAVVGNMENFFDSVPPLGTIANFFSLTITEREAQWTFEYLDADWIESSVPAEAYLPFEATGVAVEENFEDNYMVTGEIVNPYDITLETLLLTAVALDQNDKPVGVGIDYPSGGAPSGTVPFSIYTSTTEKPATVKVYAQPIFGGNPWVDTAEGNPPPPSTRDANAADASPAAASLSDAEACAYVDDLGFKLLFDVDYDATASDFEKAAGDLETRAAGLQNPVLKRFFLDLAEASRTNAEEIQRRATEEVDPFDLFFPTRAWDAAFNGKVDRACEDAGYQWREE